MQREVDKESVGEDEEVRVYVSVSRVVEDKQDPA